MTHLGTVIIVLVCVGLGYIVEPMFISGVKKKPATLAATTPEDNDPTGDTTSGTTKTPDTGPTIKVDLSKIIEADFPEKVALKQAYTVSDAESGATVTLKVGSLVKPIRIEGSQLVFQPTLIPIQSSIHVDKTNFKELAVPKMIERLQNTVVSKDPDPRPAMDKNPDPEPTPPTPDPEPAPVAKLDEAAIVSLLKKDVEAGKVTEFKANQVTEWKAGDDMEFDGKNYQAGLVTFKAETILGVQEHQAIALIEGGKVYKWMWAKTKLEMR